MPALLVLLKSSSFPIAISVVAIVAAIVAIVFVFIIKSTVDRKFSVLLRKPSTQPENCLSEKEFLQAERAHKEFDELATLVRETRAQSDATRDALNEVVRVLADSRTEEIIRGEQEGSDARLALRKLYEASRAELAPFAISLSAITPLVSSLSTCHTQNNANVATLLRALVQNYQQMQIVDSDLASKITRLSDVGPSAAVASEDARRCFDSGALMPEAYLKQIMSIHPAEKLVLPDPDVELAHYRELAAQTTDIYLSWLDRINDLRDLATEAGSYEITTACTQIIRQSRSVLEPFNVELDDVEIGRTQYDSRLHDLLHTVPRPGTRPETVVGVRKLGYRRNGTTVRKPQVVVAAAGN